MFKFLLPFLFISQLTFSQVYTWNNYNKDNSGLLSNIIFAITEDSSGNTYFGSQSFGIGGLYKFNGVTWTHYTPDNSDLISWNIDYLLTDKSGNIWIVFGNGYGVTKFDGTIFTNYSTQNSNLTSDYLYNPHLDKFNNIWFGQTGNKKITKFDGTNFTDYDLPEVYKGGLYVKDSIALVGAESNGMIKLNLNTGQSQVYTKGNSTLPGDGVSMISIDKNGLVWIGFSTGFGNAVGGIATWDYNSFDKLDAFVLSSTWIAAWHNGVADQNNNMWIASRCEGLRMFDGISWNQIGTIPSNGCEGTVYFDKQKRIWYSDITTGVWEMAEGIPTNVSNKSNDFEVKVFPDPADNQLQINIATGSITGGIISVKNILGNEVLNKKFTAQQNSLVLDISELPSGIYVTSIAGDNKLSVINWVKK